MPDTAKEELPSLVKRDQRLFGCTRSTLGHFSKTFAQQNRAPTTNVSRGKRTFHVSNHQLVSKTRDVIPCWRVKRWENVTAEFYICDGHETAACKTTGSPLFTRLS